jgi:hypothetical protein
VQSVAVHPSTHTFSVFTCGVRITVQAVTGASLPGHMTLLLPATQVNQSLGEQEVMPAPQSDVQPIGRPFVPGLGVNRMVLAGAGLPEPASGPGHLFSSRR